MPIPSFKIRFNPSRPAIDPRGVFTKEVADALTRLLDAYDEATGMINTGFEPSGSVAAHAALTSGVHGISTFAATVLDDTSAASAQRTLKLSRAKLDFIYG